MQFAANFYRKLRCNNSKFWKIVDPKHLEAWVRIGGNCQKFFAVFKYENTEQNGIPAAFKAEHLLFLDQRYPDSFTVQKVDFRVAVHACYGAYFVVDVLIYLEPNFDYVDIHDTAPENFCTTEIRTIN